MSWISCFFKQDNQSGVIMKKKNTNLKLNVVLIVEDTMANNLGCYININDQATSIACSSMISYSFCTSWNLSTSRYDLKNLKFRIQAKDTLYQ